MGHGNVTVRNVVGDRIVTGVFRYYARTRGKHEASLIKPEYRTSQAVIELRWWLRNEGAWKAYAEQSKKNRARTTTQTIGSRDFDD